MLRLRAMAVVIALAACAEGAVDVVSAEARPLFGKETSGTGWLPVLVLLTNNTSETLELDLEISDRRNLIVGRRSGVMLPPGRRSRRYLVYIYKEWNGGRTVLSIRHDGRLVELDRSRTSFWWSGRCSMFILGVARSSNALGPMRNQNFGENPLIDQNRNFGGGTEVHMVDRGNRMDPLPDHFIGYSCCSLVVLNGSAISTFTEAESEALVNWVHKGGEVVLSPGKDLSWFDSDLVKQLVTIEDVEKDPAYSGLVRKQEIAFHKMSIPGAKWASVRTHEGRRVSVAGRVDCGFGGVTVMAVDISEPAVIAWQRNQRMWTATIQQMESNPHSQVVPNEDQYSWGSWRYSSDFVKFLSFARMPALGLVGALIGLYIIIAGPVNFLILRRRRKLVYLPFAIAAVAAVYIGIIFVAGYVDKGIDSRVHKMTLVEMIPGTTEAYQRSFFSIFSSAAASYDISLPCRSATIPFSSTNHQARSSRIISEYDGNFVLADHKMTMWSTDCFASEGIVNDIGDIMYDRRSRRITNNTRYHLRDAQAVLRGTRFELEDIAPGASVVVPRVPRVMKPDAKKKAKAEFHDGARRRMYSAARVVRRDLLFARIDEEPAPVDVGTNWVDVKSEAVFLAAPLVGGASQ